MSRISLGVIVLLASCPGPAADHERLGDRAYRENRFDVALAEYLTAQATNERPRIWAKAGSAALRSKNYRAAVDAYARLGSSDPARASEALGALERVARVAVRAGDGGTIARSTAILAIRRLAPARPIGRLAGGALAPAGLSRPEQVRILPSAIGSADGARSVDSLMLVYGDALRETTACDAAARAFRTSLRRSKQAHIIAAARNGLANCALQLGRDALAADHLPEAERWLEESVANDSTGPVGWRARIEFGDARQREGDLLGAALAYQSVVSTAAAPDTLRRFASERLNALSTSPNPGTGVPPRP